MNRNNNTRTSITGDPFSDANLLENQPRGLRLEPDNGQSPRNSTSSESSSGSRDVLRGAGTLVQWSPGHDRRRRPQLPYVLFSYTLLNRRCLSDYYHRTLSRPANPSFFFPQTRLPRRPGRTHQRIREQQPSWRETEDGKKSV